MNETRATVCAIPTDALGAADYLEGLHQRILQKERETAQLRRHLHAVEQRMRARLQDRPEQLAAFEAERTEQARRRDERRSRVDALRHRKDTNE